MDNPIFSPSELEIRKPDSSWTCEDILGASGLFYLKDISRKLRINTYIVARFYREQGSANSVFWVKYGIRKIWTHWVVKMEVFANTYEEHLKPEFERIDKYKSKKELLTSNKVFQATDVCRVFSFHRGRLRQILLNKSSDRIDIGVWKSLRHNVYLVDMKKFSDWLTRNPTQSKALQDGGPKGQKRAGARRE